MKKSKFNESQIVAILKEGEAGLPVAQILRKHGISHATFYKSKSKYGGEPPRIFRRPPGLSQAAIGS